MDVTIYSLSDPITNEIRYVGKTMDMAKRMQDHIRVRKNPHNAGKYNWIQSLLRDNLCPIMEPLEIIENSNDEDWQEPETFWIKYLRFLGCHLTNLYDVGMAGRKHSEASKAKMSAVKKANKNTAWNKGLKTGKPSWNAGLKTPASVCEKLSIIASKRVGELNSFWGKTHSPETKDKIKTFLTGRPTGRKGIPHSEEHKKNLSLAFMGRIPWNKGVHTGQNTWLGKKHSPETKAKLSEGAKLRNKDRERLPNGTYK